MRFLVVLIACAAGLIGAFAPEADAQQVLVGPRRNPKVEAVVAEVSAARIEADVRKLVSFGTRHTLSDPDHPTRGIGAARRWIKSEFDRIAAESKGRLRVEEDSFVQPVAPRVPKPTTLVNLVATLPGTQPESRDRWLVVSGHYDSIPRPLTDTTADAPGANDDASGTAVVLELARVMSKHEFDATVVFLAVAGEEQGLLGATHWAETCKAQGRRIEAMFTNDIVGNTLGGNGVRDRRRSFRKGCPRTRPGPGESPEVGRRRERLGLHVRSPGSSRRPPNAI
ncbi:MAG: M20/M25/M40 family metallo-hydrolase [Isosphaeraceae bacterium]